jgi:hypothetical protein
MLKFLYDRKVKDATLFQLKVAATLSTIKMLPTVIRITYLKFYNALVASHIHSRRG